MAFDEGLAQRIRESFDDDPNVFEKRMFGGLAFLYCGNMSVGVVKDEMIVRVQPDKFEEYCAIPHARPMDFTGKKMKGWITVLPAGTETEESLRAWIERSLTYVTRLPKKG
ncbi:MAG: TfoX/Sxy family protein [Myxococcales bacterium]|nr:TfoX/Sxy family protein [Myxococcales bacterium]